MSKSLEHYMELPYRVEYIEDKLEGGFIFRCPELKGCMTCAESIEQGAQLLEDAKRSWFQACLESNIPIPEPLEDFSGQFKLRVPKSLHRLLQQRSSEEGISMNQYCVYLLSKGI